MTAVSLQKYCLVVLPHDTLPLHFYIATVNKNRYRGLRQHHCGQDSCDIFQVGPHGYEIVVQIGLVMLLFGLHLQQQQPSVLIGPPLGFWPIAQYCFIQSVPAGEEAT